MTDEQEDIYWLFRESQKIKLGQDFDSVYVNKYERK